MNCPKCGKADGIHVTNVVKDKEVTVRRVECRHCLTVMTSVEFFACEADVKGKGYIAVMKKIIAGEARIYVDGI